MAEQVYLVLTFVFVGIGTGLLVHTLIHWGLHNDVKRGKP